MSNLPSGPRRYGDDEVRRLLERAAEIQDRDALGGGGRGRGLTLAELEEIASEAGIAPAAVRRAAIEFDSDTGPRSLGSRLAGESVTIELERDVDVEIGPDAFEPIVVEIQRAVDLPGQPGVLGRTLTWRADTPAKSRSLQILVSSRDGSTHIRVEEQLHQLAGGLFGGLTAGLGAGLGIPVGLGVGLGALGSVAAAVAIPVGMIGAVFLGTRQIFAGVARSRRRRLTVLMERLVTTVEAHGRRLPPAVEWTPEP